MLIQEDVKQLPDHQTAVSCATSSPPWRGEDEERQNLLIRIQNIWNEALTARGEEKRGREERGER